jgi:hypothetical protein
MNSFFKVSLTVGGILLLLWLVVPTPVVESRLEHMPWQIELPGDGSSKVLGIHLGTSRLQDVIASYGAPEGIALFAAGPDGEAMTLEAYFGTVRIGPLAAKLVVMLQADEAEMRAMAGRALSRKPARSGAYQWLLAEEDKAASQTRMVTALTYIPLYSKLDEAFFRSRFGEPASFAQLDENRLRWFYPAKGLSIVIDSGGREVLHYQLPRDFNISRKLGATR